MDDEAIRKDAPVADQNVDPAPEQTAAPEEFKESPQGPINKREAAMARLREKRQEEREAGRKAAALMNDPDLTEEQYDAQEADQVAASDGENDEGEDLSPATTPAEDGIDGDVVAGDELESAQGAEEQSTDGPESTQDAVPAGWDRRDDGVLVKRLKVNGEIRELTQEEYDRQLSKELAGDQKLRLAAEKEQQLRQLEAELNRRQQQSQEQPPAKPAAVPDLDEAFDGFVSAFYEGDADAARERFKAIIEGRQTSTPNIDQLIADTATRVKAEFAEERHREDLANSYTKFEEEFSDIANDPVLLAAADVVLKDVQTEHPDWDVGDLYMEAGKRTRAKLALDKPGRPAPRADAERRQRKANLKPVPRAGNAAAVQPAEPQLDMSPSAKIERLRQSRAR